MQYNTMIKVVLLLSMVMNASCHVHKDVPVSAHALEEAVRIQLASLSLDQKIGQLFMVPAVSCEVQNTAFMATQPYAMHKEYIEELITQYHAGGVIFLGRGEPEKQIARTRGYQQLSAIPLFIGMDFEWGLDMRLNDTVRFPRAMTQGALSDERIIYEIGVEIGRQSRAMGVHLVFAPVVDVNNNPANPVINSRSFGDDPEAVARKAILMMQGLRDGGVVSCAKHFIGHGDTHIDSHEDLPTITHDRNRLDAVELYPFKRLIAAGVPAIMIAHLAVPALEPRANVPASLSYAIVTKLLKHELGFEGLVITDGLGMVGVTKNRERGEPEYEALLAGSDLLLCPVDVPRAVELIKQALADGRFTAAELDQRVLKILRLKAVCAQQSARAFKPEYDRTLLHTPHAYALKKQAYTQAVTLVRDNQHLLPISSEKSSVMYITGLRTPHDVAQRASAIRQEIDALRAEGRDVVAVLFGTPYALPLLDRVGTVIVAYEDDPDAREAVAKILSGELHASGILPVTVQA